MNPHNSTSGTLPPVGGQLPPQQSPHDPYDFILNAPKAPRKKILKTGSLRSRLFVILSCAVMVVIAIAVVSSLLSRSSKEVTTDLKSLVAEQQEVIRIASAGAGTSELSLRVWAATTSITVTSQQQSLTTYLAQKKIILDPTELASKLNINVNPAFQKAVVDNRFDDEFKTIFQASLLTYAKDLKTSYSKVSTPKIKALLKDSYNQIVTLLQ